MDFSHKLKILDRRRLIFKEQDLARVSTYICSHRQLVERASKQARIEPPSQNYANVKDWMWIDRHWHAAGVVYSTIACCMLQLP